MVKILSCRFSSFAAPTPPPPPAPRLPLNTLPKNKFAQVSSQRSPAVKREGSGATGGAGAQRPIADSSTSSGKPSLLLLAPH